MLTDEQKIIRALHANLDEQIRLQKELTAVIAGEVMAYNVKQAATALGVGRTTVYNMVKAGKLRQTEDGLIPRESISEMLQTKPRRRANGK